VGDSALTFPGVDEVTMPTHKSSSASNESRWRSIVADCNAWAIKERGRGGTKAKRVRAGEALRDQNAW
jgi:hypothetical protein